jgi:calcineurin-like phosphoesterase family protein
MRNIWVTSDHHFGHAKILEFTNFAGLKVRPEFSFVEEMDEILIEKWNSKIKPSDTVFHLGDITFEKENFPNIIKRLNGRKRLIVGNHDDVPWLVRQGYFSKVEMWKRYDEFGLILSHVPLHKESLMNHRQGKLMLNVHGHIHRNTMADEGYLNVSVEMTDYAPVNIEDIRIQ